MRIINFVVKIGYHVSKSGSLVLQSFVAIKIITNFSAANPFFKMLNNWSRLKKTQMSVQTTLVLIEARIQILTYSKSFSF